MILEEMDELFVRSLECTDGIESIDKEIMTHEQRMRRIATEKFITSPEFYGFLHNNGYSVQGKSLDPDMELTCILKGGFKGVKFYGGIDRHKGPIVEFGHRSLILIGPKGDWGDYVDDKLYTKKVEYNPFVKLVDWSLTSFKVFSVVKAAGRFGDTFALELEKDLSKEWITYLALKDEYYAEYILAECEEERNEIPKMIENYNNLLAEDIAILQAKNAELVDHANKRLSKCNQIQQIIKNVKNDFQV